MLWRVVSLAAFPVVAASLLWDGHALVQSHAIAHLWYSPLNTARRPCAPRLDGVYVAGYPAPTLLVKMTFVWGSPAVPD